jgi:plastocyanin
MESVVMKKTSVGFTVLFVLGLSSCTGDDDADKALATPVTVVKASGMQFSPAQVHIKVGDIVRWTWSGESHNVVSGTNCTPDGKFTSGPEAESGDLEQHFETAGTFPYFCAPHCSMGMTGEVIVEP